MSHERRRPPAPAHDGKRGILFLEDGTLFEGQGLGAPGTTYGEVVFTTGMAGYPESLTDPSYRGQILLFTYPLLGNYGIPSASSRDKFGLPVGLESRKIQPRATLFRSLTSPHHWQSSASLDHLRPAARIADRILLLDNSSTRERFALVASIDHGAITRGPRTPRWAKAALSQIEGTNRWQ